MSISRLALMLAMLAAALLPPAPLHAAAFIVNNPTDAPDALPGDGICASATGVCTLRAAIQESNASPAPDTITIAPGVYALMIPGRGENLAATGDLDITQSITISGAGQGATTIEAGGQDRAFHVIGPIAVQITGLTVRNGNVPRPADISADGGGGAIYSAAGARVTLTNVAINSSTATSGAVLNDDGGTLTVVNSTITGNTASFGGAIFNNGTTTITNSTLGSNIVSSSGGAIYNRLGSVTVAASTISQNTASSASIGGGGILNSAGASVTVTASLVAGNTASNGGGIHNRGQVTLTNSTLSANIARGSGGGIFAGGGSVSASNATLALNSADAAGGGISVAGGSVTVRNTLIAGSRGGNCAGMVVSQGYNLESTATCGLTGQGDLSGVDPILGPLAANGGATHTHSLPPGSPAIDAGSPGGGGCEGVDQRNTPRPTDGNGDGTARCDIGAFEAPTSSVPVPVVGGVPIAPLPGAVASPTVQPTAFPASVAPPTPVPAPGRSPTPAVLPTRTTDIPTAAAPPSPPEAEPEWVFVPIGTPLFAVDGTPLGEAETEDWYEVILVESDWLLAAADPEWPVWLAWKAG